MRKIAAIGFCAAWALLGDDARQQVQVTKTEQMDFPSGGLLRLNGKFASVTIEGWDQPGLQITTTKTTVDEYDAASRPKAVAELDQARFGTERKGEELTLTSELPRHGSLYLDAHIFVPRNARLAVHGSGDLYVDDVAGAVQAEMTRGTIVLHLPERGQYDVDARCKWGTVNSDFPGEERRTRWLIGHYLLDHSAATAQKLFLRVGYGDIVILKIRKPEEPGAGKPVS
jgi:hypothetical protein